jgi:hypothetical protein
VELRLVIPFSSPQDGGYVTYPSRLLLSAGPGGHLLRQIISAIGVKPVLIIDYPKSDAIHQAVFDKAARLGFTQLLTDRTLTTLVESR